MAHTAACSGPVSKGTVNLNAEAAVSPGHQGLLATEPWAPWAAHDKTRVRHERVGCSGMWSFRMWGFKRLLKNPSPMSASGVKSPHPQFLRVNQLLFSNPTSSSTTSLNTQARVSLLGPEAGAASPVAHNGPFTNYESGFQRV